MFLTLRRGFTLIELLVVIAIIAILAAILFPVFAQARHAARGAASLSNQKQISLGILMYVQDYDETFPMDHAFGAASGWCLGPCEGINITSFWTLDIAPYLKNWELYQDPLSGEGLPGIASDLGGSITWSILAQYGYNYTALSPTLPAAYNGPVPWKRTPITLAGVGSAAELVLLSEKLTYGEMPFYYWYGPGTISTFTVAEPPVCGGIPPLCFAGWTGDGVPPVANTEGGRISEDAGLWTGGVSFRKSKQGNFAFTDGHVKFMTASQAAQGTNWRPGIGYDEMTITNASRYLWLPK